MRIKLRLYRGCVPFQGATAAEGGCTATPHAHNRNSGKKDADKYGARSHTGHNSGWGCCLCAVLAAILFAARSVGNAGGRGG